MTCGSTMITLLELEKQQDDGAVRSLVEVKSWRLTGNCISYTLYCYTKEGAELRPDLEFCAEGTQDVSLWYLSTVIGGHARMVGMPHVIVRRTRSLELSLQMVVWLLRAVLQYLLLLTKCMPAILCSSLVVDTSLLLG
jgi:hypothetical protein